MPHSSRSPSPKSAPVVEESTVDVQEGLNESCKYTTHTLLEPAHFKAISGALSRKWDRVHSLSAAVRLMQAHGVTISAEEEEELAAMPEGDQISALVTKMPQQTNDQFQHFFLQLQCLVSTATRLRHGLEAGSPEDVEAALADAEATGISQYIMRVAIVQAGTEVSALRRQFAEYSAKADEKMGRLVRGQYECVTVQRKLAAAKYHLNLIGDGQSAKIAKVVMRQLSVSDHVFIGWVYEEWRRVAADEKLHRELEEQFKARLQVLEDNYTRWKAKQLQASHNTLIRTIMNTQAGKLADVIAVWVEAKEEAKFERESAGKVAALRDKLAVIKDSHREICLNAMGRMSDEAEKKYFEMGFYCWDAYRRQEKVRKEEGGTEVKVQARILEYTRLHTETAKQVIQAMAGSSDSAVLGGCFQIWADAARDARREVALTADMEAKKSRLQEFSARTKERSNYAMEKAAVLMISCLKQRVWQAWKLDTKVERNLRVHHAMIEAKRQQLQGVQQMFRNFAVQLDQGFNKAGVTSGGDFRDYVENRSRTQSGRGPGGGASGVYGEVPQPGRQDQPQRKGSRGGLSGAGASPESRTMVRNQPGSLSLPAIQGSR